MQFVHMSDTHLGYRQYGLLERENDFFEVFEEAIDEIIRERPDFVIHSGDLFEYSRPPTKALLTAQNAILKLKEEKIPIYGVAGNHDVVMKRNALPPQVLYRDFGLKLISPRKPFYVEENSSENLFIGGTPYASRYNSRYLKKRINEIEKASNDYKKRVLILHQAVDRYMPYEYELKIGDVPQSFNYCAFGHIHERIVDDFGEGKLAYSGSTEIWRSNEIEGYKKNGKGFYLVDIGGDIPEIEKIDLELPREFIKENIHFHELQEKITFIKTYIQNLKTKPLLQLTVEGGNLSRSELYETINESFAATCLSVRPTYRPDTLSEDEHAHMGEDALDVNRMLEEYLKDFDNEKVSELARGLLKEMAEGNITKASKMAGEFYEVLYDN